jgi:uncharacterized protein
MAEARFVEPIVDCDVHNAPISDEALRVYLPDDWRERRDTVGYLDASFRQYRENLGDRSYMGAEYPRPTPRASRVDAWPPSGNPPASDLDFTRSQLLDTWNVEYAVLNPLLGAAEQLNDEYGAALATAINDWQIAEWLDPEPRMRASICVAYEDAELAAAEVDRVAHDRRFVQIQLLARTREPLGRRRYWTLYEAAVRHDLPLGIHYGGWGGMPITGAGYPSFYIEDSGGMATAFQDQVTSMVLEGVFERFPTLKVVLIEGGFAWLPPLMWRLDRAWRLLRAEVPYLSRPPSETVRSQFWFTTQPMEEPPRSEDFQTLLKHLDMDGRIMFSTDYPHWDFDSPAQALPSGIDPELRRRIMGGNARALYGLQPIERTEAALG